MGTTNGELGKYMIIWKIKYIVVTTYERGYLLPQALIETDIGLRNQMYGGWGISSEDKI